MPSNPSTTCSSRRLWPWVGGVERAQTRRQSRIVSWRASYEAQLSGVSASGVVEVAV